MNKDNVYAYLALGDALERQKEITKAIGVYKDLMNQGIQVHGLKEKIMYLENILQSMKRQESNKKAAPPSASEEVS